MKFALSSLAVPDWDAATLAARAKEHGFDGVELCALPPDRPGVRESFQATGVEIACLASSIAMPAGRRQKAASAALVRDLIDAARSLACARVKILDTPVLSGRSVNSAAVEMGDWLLPLGDYAADRDVTIVVENALSFRRAREMWMMLESINHPNVAACWDVSNATRAGETPFVSVPTLNSRIQYARVKENPGGKLGEGDVPAEQFLIRLRGIGYGGYVTVESSEEFLADSIRKLHQWTKPQTAEKTKKPQLAK